MAGLMGNVDLCSSAIQYAIFFVTTRVMLSIIDRIARHQLLIAGLVICMALHYYYSDASYSTFYKLCSGLAQRRLQDKQKALAKMSPSNHTYTLAIIFYLFSLTGARSTLAVEPTNTTGICAIPQFQISNGTSGPEICCPGTRGDNVTSDVGPYCCVGGHATFDQAMLVTRPNGNCSTTILVNDPQYTQKVEKAAEEYNVTYVHDGMTMTAGETMAATATATATATASATATATATAATASSGAGLLDVAYCAMILGTVFVGTLVTL
ncbi:glucose transporter [Lecanosticta acicola]|uniref:Glucose transporter n=1 Tax=Lecanosticta acicola TaxID=111012 RepID=A0AAI9EDT9_9PEZI|nr:glucose transporter [Lecanosticta acicola]